MRMRKHFYTDKEIAIKTALMKKGLSITELAAQVGISNSYLFLILSGRRTGYNHRPNIAKILGLKQSEIFEERKAAGVNGSSDHTQLG